MDRAWRGAEAYHFWMLAHRQLYGGEYKAGLRTALNLQRYDEVLPARAIYALLVLLAFCAGFYGQCSRALARLETMEGAAEDEKEAYSSLGVSIFTRYSPKVRPPRNRAGAGRRRTTDGPAAAALVAVDCAGDHAAK